MAHDAATDSVNPEMRGSERTANADADGSGASRPTQAQQLASDWITIWHSEFRAMVANPEIRETWQAAVSLWSDGLFRLLHAWPQPNDRAAEQARSSAATGTAAAAAASDPRGAEVERLSQQVSALERRLAELERGDGPPDHRDLPPTGTSRG